MVESLRGEVSLVMFSLPGREDAIRKKLYRSIRGRPTEAERRQGQQELTATLNRFSYRGQTVAQEIVLSADNTVLDYFRQFPGLDAGAKYNGAGFWELPIPVVKDIQVVPDDIVIYDAEGYALLRNFLKESGIRHVLLAGYNTDKCVRGTCAGYSNLKGDFNVLLIHRRVCNCDYIRFILLEFMPKVILPIPTIKSEIPNCRRMICSFIDICGKVGHANI